MSPVAVINAGQKNLFLTGIDDGFLIFSHDPLHRRPRLLPRVQVDDQSHGNLPRYLQCMQQSSVLPDLLSAQRQ